MTRAAFDPAAILAALEVHGVCFVAIGGWAAGAQDAGWPTFDVDILIDVDDHNLTRLASALDALDAVYDTTHQPPIPADLRRVREHQGPQLFRTRFGRLDVLKEAGGETYASVLEDAIDVEQAGHRIRCAVGLNYLRLAGTGLEDGFG